MLIAFGGGAYVYRAGVRYGARLTWKASGRYGMPDDDGTPIEQEIMG